MFFLIIFKETYHSSKKCKLQGRTEDFLSWNGLNENLETTEVI